MSTRKLAHEQLAVNHTFLSLAKQAVLAEERAAEEKEGEERKGGGGEGGGRVTLCERLAQEVAWHDAQAEKFAGNLRK